MSISAEQFASGLRESPIIAILRGVTPETALEVGEAIIGGGIRFLEVTLNSPNALESIRLLSEAYADRDDVHIGAGTVLKPAEVGEVDKAGGEYIISPNANPDVIRETKRWSLISIPGFYTPTEAFAALDAGADYLKLFPARDLGVRYIKDIKAVLPKPIVAVGGVDMSNMAEFLTVCAAVGIGSNLYSSKKTMEELREAAKQYCTQGGNT